MEVLEQNKVERFYTAEEVAEILRVSLETAMKLIKSSGFPKLTIGKQYRIPSDEFEKWIKKYSYTEYKY